MLITFSFLFALSNVACFYIDYKQRHPFLFIWAFNIPFVVIPFFYSVFFSGVNYDVLINAILFSTLCNVVYLASTLSLLKAGVFGFRCFDLQSIDSKLNYFYGKFWLVFTLALLTIIIILFYPNYSASRGGSLQLATMYSMMFMSSFLYLFYIKKSRLLWLVVISCVFFLVVFKSRGALAYVVIPLMFIYIAKGIDLKKMAYLIAIAIFLLLLVVVIKSFRWISNDGGGGVIQILDTSLYIFSVLFTKGELALINNFYDVYETCGASQSFCYNWTVINKFFVARFTGEPTLNAAYLIWNFIKGTYNVGGSLHSLSYGVAFFDGGWLGVIYFIFLAFLRMLIFILMKNKYSLMFLGPVLYFTLFFSRGSLYNSLMPLVVCFMFFLIMIFFQALFLKIANK